MQNMISPVRFSLPELAVAVTFTVVSLFAVVALPPMAGSILIQPDSLPQIHYPLAVTVRVLVSPSPAKLRACSETVIAGVISGFAGSLWQEVENRRAAATAAIIVLKLVLVIVMWLLHALPRAGASARNHKYKK